MPLRHLTNCQFLPLTVLSLAANIPRSPHRFLAQEGVCVICRLGLFFCLATVATSAQMTKHIGYSTFAGLEPMVAVSLDQPVQTYQKAEAQNYMASARFADAPAGTPSVPNTTPIEIGRAHV